MYSANEWMLKAVRSDAENLNRMPLLWLEFVRDSWTPLVMRALSFILNGGTFLLCTDSKREWLKHYILSKINNADRPLVPIYAFDESLARLLQTEDHQALQDILSMSYQSYALWYIGTMNNELAKFALRFPESFLWVFDDSLEHSFVLDSKDPNLDFKLIQTYRIFEQALFAGICGEFHVENF